MKTHPDSEKELLQLFVDSLGSLGAKRYLTSTVERVWSLYTEKPGRIYHAKPHIKHVVRWILERVGRSDPKLGIFIPRLITSALWHDAIYIIGSGVNEKESALLLDRDLTSVGVQRHHIDLMVNNVLDTQHKKEPETMEGKCMVDADLSSLALPFDKVWEHTLDLYRESGKKGVDFAKGNSSFLETLINRSCVYYSPFMTQDDENTARKNIIEIIRRLNGWVSGEIPVFTTA